MGIPQKVLFGGIDLLGTNDNVFDPSFGPVDFQTLRRQPFGLRGELELRGENGGQSIVIPVRMFRPTYGALAKAINDIRYFKQGKHDKLAVQFNGGSAASKETFGEVTFESVQELSPPRAIAYDGGADRAGFAAGVAFVFRKLNVDD